MWTLGVYRTFRALLHRDDPTIVLYRSDPEPLISSNPEVTRPIEHQMYLYDVVFTTGAADGGDHFIVASGEADLACRVTHAPKSRFEL